jgi:hypothetical protein
MFTSIVIILVCIVSVAAGFGIASWINRNSLSEKKEIRTESSVLLERIEKVFKVVLAEGHFSEIYDYEDNKEIFLGIKGPKKKALIVAKAKVMVGYDFSKAKIKWEEGQRKMIVETMPAPEVLSIDSDYNIYDIDQGFFNKFDSKEYTKLLTDAKQTIHNKAIASELPNIAQKQLTVMMNQMAMSMGWQLDYQQTAIDANNKGQGLLFAGQNKQIQ